MVYNWAITFTSVLLFEKLTNRTAGTLPVRSRCGHGTVTVWLRFGRGAVEACLQRGQGTLKVRSQCDRGAFEAWLRHARGTVEVRPQCGEVRSWCGRGTLVVRSRYACGAVEVRFQYAHWCGSSSVRYLNFLSGGTLRKFMHPLNHHTFNCSGK